MRCAKCSREIGGAMAVAHHYQNCRAPTIDERFEEWWSGGEGRSPFVKESCRHAFMAGARARQG